MEKTEVLAEWKDASFTILSYFGILNGVTGYEFIKEMYKYMISKNNISEAVRLAKIKLVFSPKYISSLWYQLWGNPNLYL